MEQSENKLYGEKIRNYLQNNGITFVDFAKKVGTSQGALSNWISGARCAKRANVKAIARAMGCKISDISGYSDDPELIQFERSQSRRN